MIIYNSKFVRFVYNTDRGIVVPTIRDDRLLRHFTEVRHRGLNEYSIPRSFIVD